MSEASGQDDTRVASRSADGSAPPALPPGAPTRIGRFELRAMLGEGAFGRVYRGFDSELRRDVAIKVPHLAGLDDEFRERFLREARAIATIHHPNLCPVYEVGTDGQLPYIVMRFVAGTTLANVIDNLKTPMPVRNAVMIVRKLALGMAAAHAQGVTHRDLKPANVLYDTANREVLITDFGLAHVGGEMNLTAKDTFLGTPAYSSPEQADRRIDAVGPLADLYSLGVILYEMLTGDVPFNGSVMEVAMAHCITPPTPPSQVRSGIDEKLEAIVLKAMAKKPADRYPSTKAFAEVLTDYLRPTDQSAAPTGSVSDMPAIALGGGREPEQATETVAEKQAGKRTAPAFEVVSPPPPPAVVEVVEEEDAGAGAEAAKEARRSGNRKSAKKAKGGKKKKRGEDVSPFVALLQNKVVWAGAAVAFVALVLLVVFLLKSKKAPETVQTPTPDPVAAPVQPPPQQTKGEPKVEPKVNPKGKPKVDAAAEKLRLALLDKWKFTSAPGFDAAAFAKLDKQGRYLYLTFNADGTAELGLDSNNADDQAKLAKEKGARFAMQFRATSSNQCEFYGMPADFQGIKLGTETRMTVDQTGNSLTLTNKNGTWRLIRNQPR